MVHSDPRTNVIILRVTHYSITFCHNNDFVPRNIVCAQRIRDDSFGLTIGIYVGGIPLWAIRDHSTKIVEHACSIDSAIISSF
jgi:hypothetical protein